MAKLLCSLFLAGFVLQANAFPISFPHIPNPFDLIPDFLNPFKIIPDVINPFKIIPNIFHNIPNPINWVLRPFSKLGKDPCTLQHVVGLCNESHSRYYYDIQENGCKKFTYSGCNGNKNNFESKKECEKRCKKD